MPGRLISVLALVWIAAGCGTLDANVSLFDVQGYGQYLKLKENLPKVIEAEKAVAREVKADEVAVAEAKRKSGDAKGDESSRKMLEDANVKLAQDKDSLRRAIDVRRRVRSYLALVESNNPFADWFGLLVGVESATPEALNSDATALTSDLSKQPKFSTLSQATTRPVDKTASPSAIQINGMKEASQVVYAPNKFWRKQINSARGAGAYGNVDIAIRMKPDPDYSIKGFRVDSAKLIANTVSLTRQAVAAVAASYGIPTNLGGGGNTAMKFDLKDELSKLAEVTQAAKLNGKAIRVAEHAMLAALSSEADNLADPAKTADAMKRIQGVYAAQRKLLDDGSKD